MKKENTRQFWVDTMEKIVEPVLSALAEGNLRKKLPESLHKDRSVYASLEAFGRTVSGIAPWLAAENLSEEEKGRQEKYILLVQKGVAEAVNPYSADYMGECHGPQMLVDMAFLAHAVVRAPKIFTQLSPTAKEQLIAVFKTTRTIMPYENNWILFSAMIEAGLYCLGAADFDQLRINYAIRTFMGWYCGDGIYGDGKNFHWDYYNSFVIQPMLVDLVKLFRDDTGNEEYEEVKRKIFLRAGRYAEILERMVAPDGSYPIIGRSITYRFGAFQMLSQAALQNLLPNSLPSAQVRCALTAVMKKTIEAKALFDEHGWLTPGIYGYQPSLMEPYISVGSPYLCTTIFLALGLPPSDSFWADEDLPWTSLRIWNGQDLPADHAIE